MEFQAVFLDIDGTLVTNRQLVPSATEVITRLKSRGYQVALCTGRSTVHTTQVQQHLGVENAVYFNGGLAVTDDDVTLSMPLSSHTIRKIIEVGSEHDLPLIFHTKDSTLSPAELPSKYQEILADYQFPPIEKTSVDTILAGQIGDIYQANVFVTSDYDPVFAKVIPECLVYRWNPHAIDLQRLGCDKSIGAQTLLDRWNITPMQAIHVGDGGNDIGMFKAMGLGIAMGNAEDDVKEHASIITDRAENDGVLKALERLQLI